jgi:hypothetical protein
MEDKERLILRFGTDAQLWAEEFCKHFNVYDHDKVTTDEDMCDIMLEWFTKTIEAGREAGFETGSGAACYG